MSEFHSLANLIKRLEVATTRLEDLATSASSASAVAASSASPPPALPTGAASSTPASVQKHDDAVGPLLNKFLDISKTIGDPVATQVYIYKARKTENVSILFFFQFSDYALHFIFY